MTKRWCLPLLLVLVITTPRAAGPTIAIDATSSSGKVSPLFYGLMTEEINHAYDGGLYAELVRNRAFLDDAQAPVHWSVVQGNDAAAAIALDPGEPLNQAIGTSLRLDVTEASVAHAAGVANEGYWGFPVRPHTRYRASLFAKAAPGFDGSITLALQSADGATVYASGNVSGVTQDWKRFEVTLTTGDVPTTANARYALLVNRSGRLWVSLVSLFPPTFKDQPNGFRPDLLQMLVRVRHRRGHIKVGRAAREGRPPRTVQADLRRGRQRGLLRSVWLVRSALRAVSESHQSEVSPAQGDLDRRLRAAGGQAGPQRQAGRRGRTLLPDGRYVPEDGPRALRDIRPHGTGNLRRRVGGV